METISIDFIHMFGEKYLFNDLLGYWFDDQEIFNQHCLDDNLEVCKMLYKTKMIDKTYIGDLFRISCENNNIEMAQWLHKIGNIDIHVNKDSVFRHSCANGYHELAKWLHKLGGVDIYASNDYAFRKSYKNGHYDVYIWLYDIQMEKYIPSHIVKKLLICIAIYFLYIISYALDLFP
jgi:hypothetical protein